jgi:hypothetical protein
LKGSICQSRIGSQQIGAAAVYVKNYGFHAVAADNSGVNPFSKLNNAIFLGRICTPLFATLMKTNSLIVTQNTANQPFQIHRYTNVVFGSIRTDGQGIGSERAMIKKVPNGAVFVTGTYNRSKGKSHFSGIPEGNRCTKITGIDRYIQLLLRISHPLAKQFSVKAK